MAIDYVNTLLYIGDTLQVATDNTLAFSDFLFVRRSVLLPAVIKGKKTMLYFDTGSSAFAFLTDKATCESLADTDSTWQTYPVASWDRMLTAHTISTTANVEIASQILPIKYATYIEGASNQQIDQMRKLGIGGMTGNKLFLNSMLVLDTKQKKFGILMKRKK